MPTTWAFCGHFAPISDSPPSSQKSFNMQIRSGNFPHQNPPGTFHYTLNKSKGLSFWLLPTDLVFLTLLKPAPSSGPLHFPLPWMPSPLLHVLFLTTLSPWIRHHLFREMGPDNTMKIVPSPFPDALLSVPLLCFIFLHNTYFLTFYITKSIVHSAYQTMF